MKSNLSYLILGELVRLIKYKVHLVSLLLLFLWFVILSIIKDNQLFNQFLPMILSVDATMMAILFIGSILFFEKSEQTVSTLLVTPIKKRHLIESKIITNIIHLTTTSLLLTLLFVIIRGIEINFIILITALILSIWLHSLIGFLFSFLTKSFTSMLVFLMAYSLLLMIPTFLKSSNLFFTNALFDYLFLINPQYAVSILIEASLTSNDVLLPILAYLSLILYIVFFSLVVVYPNYQKSAIKQSGV